MIFLMGLLDCCKKKKNRYCWFVPVPAANKMWAFYTWTMLLQNILKNIFVLLLYKLIGFLASKLAAAKCSLKFIFVCQFNFRFSLRCRFVHRWRTLLRPTKKKVPKLAASRESSASRPQSPVCLNWTLCNTSNKMILRKRGCLSELGCQIALLLSLYTAGLPLGVAAALKKSSRVSKNKKPFRLNVTTLVKTNPLIKCIVKSIKTWTTNRDTFVD